MTGLFKYVMTEVKGVYSKNVSGSRSGRSTVYPDTGNLLITSRKTRMCSLQMKGIAIG